VAADRFAADHGLALELAAALHSQVEPALHARSEWITAPGGGVRESIAIPSALVTSAAVGEASMDQPTTRRE
jgi:hypothetical protein